MRRPLAFFWDGHAMVPLLRFAKEAHRRFTVGEQYKMKPEHDRSVASHNSYFADSIRCGASSASTSNSRPLTTCAGTPSSSAAITMRRGGSFPASAMRERPQSF